MATVERQIEEVVDYVDGGGDRAERDECDGGLPQHDRVEVLRRQHHRHRDQPVLGPLMHTQHLENSLQRPLGASHQFAAISGLPARHDGEARGIEDLEVMAAVAGIVEAAIAIDRDKRGTFPGGGEIVDTVGGDDLVENAEMRSDRFGELARRAGCQHQLAPVRAFGVQPGQ